MVMDRWGTRQNAQVMPCYVFLHGCGIAKWANRSVCNEELRELVFRLFKVERAVPQKLLPLKTKALKDLMYWDALVDSSGNPDIGIDLSPAKHAQIRDCVPCKLLRLSEENFLSYRTTLSRLPGQTYKLFRFDPIYTTWVQETRTSESRSPRRGGLPVANR
jgi:hypothetical protein